MIISDLSYIYPEITITAMASIILVLDRSLSRLTRWFPYLLSQITLLIALVFIIKLMPDVPRTLFDGAFAWDAIGNTIKLMICTYAIIAFMYSRRYIWDHNILGAEYFVLCLFSILGMMTLVSAANFISLYLGLELLALPLYALIALLKEEDKKASEAAMKYFVMGAIASGMLLYGISLLYGITGSIELATVAEALSRLTIDTPTAALFGVVFVIVGLAFKLGAVPFHMWVPDIYEGAPTSVTLFIGTLPKLAAFGMAIRLLMDSLPALSPHWQPLLVVMSILSMAVGNIVAIAQTNIKRMLAYSTIGHVGFLLLGLLAGPESGYSAAFTYVIIYSLTTLGAFGIILSLSKKGFEADKLSDYQGLGITHPWIAFLMLLILFSLAGVPPLVGFYAKFLVLQAVINAGFVWLAALAVLFSVVGTFFYLRVIRIMFFESPSSLKQTELPSWQTISNEGVILLSMNSLALLVFGIYPVPILNLVEKAFS
jgi:NADH-quinone oxidoreductase subunit N